MKRSTKPRLLEETVSKSRVPSVSWLVTHLLRLLFRLVALRVLWSGRAELPVASVVIAGLRASSRTFFFAFPQSVVYFPTLCDSVFLPCEARHSAIPR